MYTFIATSGATLFIVYITRVVNHFKLTAVPPIEHANIQDLFIRTIQIALLFAVYIYIKLSMKYAPTEAKLFIFSWIRTHHETTPCYGGYTPYSQCLDGGPLTPTCVFKIYSLLKLIFLPKQKESVKVALGNYQSLDRK